VNAPAQNHADPVADGRVRRVLAAFAVLVFLSRALFLPPTLEDIDSVNFALALDRFEPLQHQPHPPGYPVYVFLARLVHLVLPDPARALSMLSAIVQALLVFPLFWLFTHLASSRTRAVISTLLVLACPTLWFTGARPMSDSVGLLFVVTTQGLLMGAGRSPRSLIAASFLCGLSLGVRLQTGVLTFPLLLFALVRSRSFRWPLAAAGAGTLVWLIPLVIASQGPAAFAHAFGQTMGDAASAEPLLSGFTLNRAARALVRVFFGPWVSLPLGGLVTACAGIGFVGLLRKREAPFWLGILAFLPYLTAHTLIQQVEALRYTLPYIPWIGWLAVEGIGMMAARFRLLASMEFLGAGGIAVASSAITLPALSLYHVVPSPPYAAFDRVRERAVEPHDFVLAGHYMFSRYFDLRPPGLEVLRAAPDEVRSVLAKHFLSGDVRPILFVADPPRTELMSLAPDSRTQLGRWEWPSQIRPFMSAARPNEAELFELRQPLFFSGEGWLLSLEPGRVAAVTRESLRDAYVKPLASPSFLLLSGRPTGPAAGCSLVVDLPALLHTEASCSGPLLGGYFLAPGHAGVDYTRLTLVSHRDGAEAPMPFALEGLSYGRVSSPGLVQGEGWYLPERDEASRSFRWTAGKARALFHIPPQGARLVVEGVIPTAYVGDDVTVEISDGAEVIASTRSRVRQFRLQAFFSGGGPAFREVTLSASRSFVPDQVQRNGDQRELALRVYRFSLESAPEER